MDDQKNCFDIGTLDSGERSLPFEVLFHKTLWDGVLLLYSPYNVRFRHTDTRCFYAYQNFGNKIAQSCMMMQFGVKLSRSTSTPYVVVLLKTFV